MDLDGAEPIAHLPQPPRDRGRPVRRLRRQGREGPQRLTISIVKVMEGRKARSVGPGVPYDPGSDHQKQ